MPYKPPMPDELIAELANKFRSRWRNGQAVRPWLRKHASELIDLMRDEWTWASLGKALTLAGITYRTNRPWDGEHLRSQVARAMAPRKERNSATWVTTPRGKAKRPLPMLNNEAVDQLQHCKIISPEGPTTYAEYPTTFDLGPASREGRKRTASVTAPQGNPSPWLGEGMADQFRDIKIIWPDNLMPYSGYPMPYDFIPAAPRKGRKRTVFVTPPRKAKRPRPMLDKDAADQLRRCKIIFRENPMIHAGYPMTYYHVPAAPAVVPGPTYDLPAHFISTETRHLTDDRDPMDRARPALDKNAPEQTERIISKLLGEPIADDRAPVAPVVPGPTYELPAHFFQRDWGI